MTSMDSTVNFVLFLAFWLLWIWSMKYKVINPSKEETGRDWWSKNLNEILKKTNSIYYLPSSLKACMVSGLGALLGCVVQWVFFKWRFERRLQHMNPLNCLDWEVLTLLLFSGIHGFELGPERVWPHTKLQIHDPSRFLIHDWHVKLGLAHGFSSSSILGVAILHSYPTKYTQI